MWPHMHGCATHHAKVTHTNMCCSRRGVLALVLCCVTSCHVVNGCCVHSSSSSGVRITRHAAPPSECLYICVQLNEQSNSQRQVELWQMQPGACVKLCHRPRSPVRVAAQQGRRRCCLQIALGRLHLLLSGEPNPSTWRANAASIAAAAHRRTHDERHSSYDGHTCSWTVNTLHFSWSGLHGMYVRTLHARSSVPHVCADSTPTCPHVGTCGNAQSQCIRLLGLEAVGSAVLFEVARFVKRGPPVLDFVCSPSALKQSRRRDVGFSLIEDSVQYNIQT
jgi:hypothetical protein